MNSILKTIAVASTGLLLGAIIWAWLTFGTVVVFAYAAGVAMICF